MSTSTSGMLQRGTANTRWRDFTTMRPLSGSLTELPGLAQPKWSAWRRKQLLLNRVPEQFSEVLDRIGEFADPVINGAGEGGIWDPVARAWA